MAADRRDPNRIDTIAAVDPRIGPPLSANAARRVAACSAEQCAASGECGCRCAVAAITSAAATPATNPRDV